MIRVFYNRFIITVVIENETYNIIYLHNTIFHIEILYSEYFSIRKYNYKYYDNKVFIWNLINIKCNLRDNHYSIIIKNNCYYKFNLKKIIISFHENYIKYFLELTQICCLYKG